MHKGMRSGGDLKGDQNHFYVGLKYQGGQMVTQMENMKQDPK